MLQVSGVSTVLRRGVFSARGLAASAAVALLCLVAGAQAQTPAQSLLVLSGNNRPALALNFLGGSLPSQVTFTRSSGATSALYTDAAAASFTTYTSNQPRLSSNGLLIEQAATNSLLNSGVPATQTTGSLATGTYVFFCNGTGSVTSSLGTATATGVGALTCSLGTFQTISVTVSGTLTFTKSGTVNWFDLQNTTFPTSHIVTAGSTATRSADVATAATSAFAWNDAAGTFVATIITEGQNPSIARYIGGNNSIGNPGFITQNGGNTSVGTWNGTNNLTLTNGAINLAVLTKMGLSWSASGRSLTANGLTPVTDAFSVNGGTPVTVINVMGIGSVTASGWIQTLQYYNRRLPNSQIQALTH